MRLRKNMKRHSDENYMIRTSDMAATYPFFDTYIGKGVARFLLSITGVNKLNKIHAKYCHLDKFEMTSAILSDPMVNVKYQLHGEEHLQKMKEMGAFYTISNHPFGGLDGVILIDIITRVRPDFCVLVNEILTKVTGLSDVWIPVSPPVNKKDYVHDPSKNIYGVRRVAECITSGRPVGMFPAGGVPIFNHELKRPVEQEWQMNNVRIMRRSTIPIFPIAFAGDNSRIYYRIGEKIGYHNAALGLPAEILKKKGTTIDVYIGDPIMPSEIKDFNDLKSLRSFLRKRTLGMLPSYKDLV